MRSWAEIAYRNRGAMLAIPYVFTIVVYYGETERDVFVWFFGLLVFSAGFCLRVWARTHHPYRVAVRVGPTTTGPYAYVRNPIYLANIAMLAGAAILSELLWFVPIMIVWCFTVYTFVVKREEAHLSNKFGSLYDAYLGAVARWLPKIRHHLSATVNANRRPLAGCIVAELRCLLLCLPLIGKEIASEMWRLGA